MRSAPGEAVQHLAGASEPLDVGLVVDPPDVEESVGERDGLTVGNSGL